MLLIAVMLPTAALGVAVSVLLSERYRTAREGSAIARRIPALTWFVGLHAQIDQERIQTETRLRTEELGGSGATSIAGALGLGGGTVASARADVDAQLRAAKADVPASFAEELQTLRHEVDAGRAGAREVDQGYAKLSEALSAAVDARLSGLRKLTARTSNAGPLDVSLATLEEANNVLRTGSNEVGTLSDVYLDSEPQRSIDLGSLAVQVPLFGSARGQLLAGGVPAVRSALAQLTGSASWRGYETAAAAAVRGRAPSLRAKALASPLGNVFGNSSLLNVVAPLLSGWVGMQKVYKVVELAAHDARREAASLQAKGSSGYKTLLIEAIIGLGLTIAVALLLARSISRPLRRLEAHARAVSAGNLELTRLRPSGPIETVVASNAFNDLVANLRLLEAKARTLAACTFDDPVLSETLPGRLGQALEESIDVLSGSIVEREQLQKRLAHQATHDSLTGLHNRAAAVEFLDQAVARAGRSSKALAVMFVDLDDFKRANDTYGHAVGDVILTSVAARISSVARGTDFIARLGGDEFIVICEGLDDVQEAATVASRLVETLSQPVDADGMIITVTASVGIAYALDGAADEGSQLLARADLALYRAKRSDHSSVEVYDDVLREELVRHAEAEKDLVASLENDGHGLFLEYQPVIDAASGELESVEALIRWDRAGHGRCQPDDFIPVAESSDLIVQLDRWVLRTALAQQLTWRSQGAGEIAVAVNISARHLLSGRLVEHVTTALRDGAGDPARLTLELTETVLLTDLPSVALDLQRLRDVGVRVAIDDFGTGYTSLAHLQHLTVDTVKIDRSFTSQLPGARDRRLVELVTDVGHHLGLSVVAEGVENEEQLSELRDIGCDLLQGFVFARPLAAEQVAGWRPAPLDAMSTSRAEASSGELSL
jgi:diguanylate cyclase (GGDEF)-like protein